MQGSALCTAFAGRLGWYRLPVDGLTGTDLNRWYDTSDGTVDDLPD